MKLYLRNLSQLPEFLSNLGPISGKDILTLEYIDGRTNDAGEWVTFKEDIDACEIIKDYKDNNERELLIELNKREFSKLIKEITKVKDLIKTTNPDKSALIDHYYNKLHILDELEKQFYPWFENNGVSLDTLFDNTHSENEANDSPNVVFGYDWSDWDEDILGRQKMVEAIVEHARKDTSKSPEYWKIQFKNHFNVTVYTELYRCRKKFKEDNPSEKFSTNGMSFYRNNR
mgnify:CR=1 FL=1